MHRLSLNMKRRVTVAVAALAAVLAGVWLLWGPLDLANRINRETLDRLVVEAGVYGPLLVVGLMTLAIVASPIPSAPIAMASGAAYGHLWGTLWVILGAEAGALIAFALARLLGRDAMLRWFGNRIEQGRLLGSQNALTAVVLASRLMPFVSFDLISYAAGLSAPHFWRFALATLAGIAPASFLLAHFGTAAASGDASMLTWAAALALGAVTGAPLVWVAWRGTRQDKEESG